ncbi:GNAT family N-acetyltransferase [Rhodohalobacter mucosus]|uniref:N-acetyltransferase n=1 Tax=Rhodohalobacter mucosus TaxID=2079485 RepID=A0A316TXQ0_9BACT|nr:GNAT family N-acetyltransferase [Rhodohalobacter mucosus]PWN08105.1 N-acetyltransferase [Rhodohalobacter mucosus]
MIRIRQATREDAYAITAILNQAVKSGRETAFTDPVPVTDREEWLAHHDQTGYPVFVAAETKTDQVMGYLSLSPWRAGRDALRHTAEISYYVHEGFRRRGVAAALMTHAIEECAPLEIDRLLAILLDINEPSISLLEKFGFERWGHFPGVARLKDLRAGQYIYGLSLH